MESISWFITISDQASFLRQHLLPVFCQVSSMILLQSLVSNYSTVIHNMEDFWGFSRLSERVCCCCWDFVFVCAHSLLSDNTNSSNASHIVKFWHLSCSRSLVGRLLHYSCLHTVNQCWNVGCLFSIFSRVSKCFSISILVIFTMKAMLLNSCTGKTHPSSCFRERLDNWTHLWFIVFCMYF